MDILAKLTESESIALQKLSNAAHDLEVEAYVVGGFVRDKLLQRPCHDIDVVCVGSGIDFAVKSAALFKNSSKLAVFKRFGTAMFKANEFEFEFVGARKESYRSNSRKPIVENGTIEDDQNRRDFTINTLAISLNKTNYGHLIDPFNGLQDLHKKRIITPLDPDITFSDDPLRMIRAIRFATQLNFFISPKTLKSITLQKERIKIVSVERINVELNKIILADKPSIGFDLLFQTGLLDYILPLMSNLYGVEKRNGKAHKDNFYHTLEVLDNISKNTNNLWLRWAAILHDIAKPHTKRFNDKNGWTFHGHEVVGANLVPKIFKGLRLPLDQQMKYVQKLVRLHLRPISLTKKNITDSAIRRIIVDAGEDLNDLLILCEADITSKNRLKVKKYLENYKMVRERINLVIERDNLANWRPPITGQMIMTTFNIKPSKDVGNLKNIVQEAILDGLVENDWLKAYNFLIKEGEKRGFEVVIRLTKDEIISKSIK